MKLLHAVRPIVGFLPEVERPSFKLTLQDRMLWSGAVLLVYLVCCQIPLYGIQTAQTSDPYYYMRVVLASNRGTLMELGIAPIVSTGMVLQMLVGARMLEVDPNNKEDRALFQGAQKLLAILVTFAQASLYVASGIYGSLSAIGAGNAILVVLQLTLAGVVVLSLDDILNKGYGMGSSGGISLFVASHICETIVWQAVSPTSITTGKGTEFEGALIAFVHLLVARPNKFKAIAEAVARTHLPNLTSVVATVVVFGLAVYFQQWRVTLQVKYQKYRGQEGNYPIRLFYTSNMPVVLLTAFNCNVFFLSKILYNSEPNNIFSHVLGVWKYPEGSEEGMAQQVPVSGLAYYISPPQSLSELYMDPFHVIFYLFFVMTACAIFSKSWMEISGSAPRHVARQLREQQIAMKGHRDSAMMSVLVRYIPASAALGGMIIGALTVLADWTGALGSGTGIVLAVTTVHELYAAFAQLNFKETMGNNAAAAALMQ